jgi:hypothetical protein
MRLMRRLRQDERGSALVIAVATTAILLALGLALLTIVDTQASESSSDRTRDRGFNLAESVLNSEAFALGRIWPDTLPTDNRNCGATGMGFDDLVGASAAETDTRILALRPNINASYTDSAYAGSSWQVNICDNVTTSNVWSNSLLNTQSSWDSNGDKLVWVRAEAKIGTIKRAVVGLVRARTLHPLNSKYGLVAGNVSEDLGPAVSAVTSTATSISLLNSLAGQLLSPTAPPVAPDAGYASPTSGVTGVRCGLLDAIGSVKTCVTGAIGALSQVALVDTLLTQSRFEQFPTVTSTSADSIGQLRTQSKTSPGVYKASVPTGGATAAAATSCNITGATVDSVVFIEKVGTGDQWCYIDVTTSVTYKALVIGSGRVVIRGNNVITPYSTVGANRFTGVIYALNNQSSAAEQASAASPKELIRVEKGARVTGAVHADGKNATIGLIAPDFDTNTLVCALLTCPSVLATTLQALGVTSLLNTLISGNCLLTVIVCVVPGPSPAALLGALTTQLSTYGSAIHSDVTAINRLSVYGTSGVVSGTFRDLQQR